MDFHILKYHSPIIRVNEVPPHYSQFRMPAARPLYVRGAFGEYLTQIISAAGYHIQFNIFNILTDKEICPYSYYSAIPLHFMLRGNIKCLLQGFGEAWLIEKCINLFYVPGKIYHKAWFKPGFYKSFHIDFSPCTLKFLATKYRELENVLTRTAGQSDEGIQQHTSYITPAVQKIVYEVIHDCPVGEPDLSTFAEIKGKELLLKYLQNVPLISSRKTEKEFIDDVATFMKTHLDYPFTIRLLATIFSTNETALKKQFKRYRGQTIYSFLTARRMNEALRLLNLNELSIRDISISIGYDDFSSFDRAFSHYFGHSPSFYHRK